MKKIIINEKAEQKLISLMVNEGFNYSDKVLLVKQFLDDNFARADSVEIGDNGHPKTNQVVAWLDKYKQLIKNITDKQLFYVVQDKFKNLFSSKSERDEFLKQVIKDWYYHKITKNGSLSN